jgi:hypothetical protein
LYYIVKKVIWEYEEYLECRLENTVAAEKIMFSEKVENIPPEGLNYTLVSNCKKVEDFLYTNSEQYRLASQELTNALLTLKLNVQYIPSSVKTIENQIISDRLYTLNPLDRLFCADLENSVVKIKEKPHLGLKTYRFNKLVLDKSKIPDSIKLFTLAEKPRWVIVHQDVVDAVNKVNPVGIKFILVDEFNCI